MDFKRQQKKDKQKKVNERYTQMERKADEKKSTCNVDVVRRLAIE